MRQRVAAATVAVLVVTAGGLVGYAGGVFELPGEDNHECAVVTLLDTDGTELATVRARVADTRKERLRGLSEADRLRNGSGMLFVYNGEAPRTYGMRKMSFPLDIIFVAANGTVTAIFSAPAPSDDTERVPRHTALAKYVLEVPRGYADRVGLDVGDRVRVHYRD